uniref:TonB-dependent receptor n=1 Tax=Onchocerca flexuosa TaxID=387005 RepID=A0A183HSQ8_9BILA
LTLLRSIFEIDNLIFFPNYLNLLKYIYNFSKGQLLNSSNPRIAVNNISLARTSVYYENASALLVDLLSDYDMRLRPGFGGQYSGAFRFI